MRTILLTLAAVVVITTALIAWAAYASGPHEDGDARLGRAVIQRAGCGSCHIIPGITGATGLVGPSLERIASRTYVAGVLTNTEDHLKQWIRNPPAVDEKTAMPNLHLSDEEIDQVVAYLKRLK